MGGVEWLLLITLSLLWGGSFFFTEVALTDCRPSRSCSAGSDWQPARSCCW